MCCNRISVYLHSKALPVIELRILSFLCSFNDICWDKTQTAGFSHLSEWSNIMLIWQQIPEKYRFEGGIIQS